MDTQVVSETEHRERQPDVETLKHIAYKERNKDSDGEKYEANFSFQNFLTLFTIQVKVEPSKGNEFCRASSICPMTIQLEQCNDSPHTNLYYEVSALDKNTFVCQSCHVI